MANMHSLYSEHASRKINGQAVLQAIVAANAPVSRAELARELGLSKQTLSEIMALLEGAQWIKPSGRKQGALGRAALGYELNPDVGYVVGVVFEGHHYVMGLADMRGQIRAKKTGKLLPKALEDGTALLDQLCMLIDGLMADVNLQKHQIRHMVIGCPGAVDPLTMRVHHSPNLRSLQDIDLRKLLAQRFDSGVQLDNDLNLHAYGEFRYGCSQNTGSSVYIGVGTGIGMGIMLMGQIWRGARGGAGEIGYMPIDRQPQSEEAQRRGALEFSVAAALREAASSVGVDSDAIERLAQDCAFAIAAIVPILDPDLVILGGDKGSDAQLHARLPRWLRLYSADAITVRKSALGQDAGLLGAIAMALQASQVQLFSSATTEGASAAAT